VARRSRKVCCFVGCARPSAATKDLDVRGEPLLSVARLAHSCLARWPAKTVTDTGRGGETRAVVTRSRRVGATSTSDRVRRAIRRSTRSPKDNFQGPEARLGSLRSRPIGAGASSRGGRRRRATTGGTTVCRSIAARSRPAWLNGVLYTAAVWPARGGCDRCGKPASKWWMWNGMDENEGGRDRKARRATRRAEVRLLDDGSRSAFRHHNRLSWSSIRRQDRTMVPSFGW